MSEPVFQERHSSLASVLMSFQGITLHVFGLPKIYPIYYVLSKLLAANCFVYLQLVHVYLAINTLNSFGVFTFQIIMWIKQNEHIDLN